jgi:hypothetical protein
MILSTLTLLYYVSFLLHYIIDIPFPLSLFVYSLFTTTTITMLSWLYIYIYTSSFVGLLYD